MVDSHGDPCLVQTVEDGPHEGQAARHPDIIVGASEDSRERQ
ncbi:MAG: hypothetical protein ACRDZX_05235 [Acidimicrobiales bacterium]